VSVRAHSKWYFSSKYRSKRLNRTVDFRHATDNSITYPSVNLFSSLFDLFFPAERAEIDFRKQRPPVWCHGGIFGQAELPKTEVVFFY
jgi:hypothetical protein